MTPGPGQPPNPALIIADTSALLQLILAEESAPFRILKSDYGIQVAIVEAVESEVRRKIRNHYPTKNTFLRKLLASSVATMDRALLAASGYRPADAVLEQIDRVGEDYSARIDRGEAYTHAAGNVLGVPTLSQDLVALWKLRHDHISVQQPVLRAFDLLLFGLQIGEVPMDACEKVRKQLLKFGETLLECFRNCSVHDGLQKFYPRLCDAEQPIIGAPVPQDIFDERIYVRRTRQQVLLNTSTPLIEG